MRKAQTPIARAVNTVGSQRELARITGYSQHAIWHALQRGKVSAEMAIAIERATDGAVTARDLRPDIFSEIQTTRTA